MTYEFYSDVIVHINLILLVIVLCPFPHMVHQHWVPRSVVAETGFAKEP